MAKVNMKEVEKLQKALNLSKEEAIELWKCDNGQSENNEQNDLDSKAKKVKIDHDVSNKNKGAKKVVTKEVPQEKINLYETIFKALAEGGYAPKDEKVNQSIAVAIGNKEFTINLVLHRPSKV